MEQRKHAVIAGTGRAGTSFLVRFLDACGLETGSKDAQWFPRARAGLEHRLSLAPTLPYVVKDPWLFSYCEQIDLDDITIDALILPMRDLMDAAVSRVYQEQLSRIDTTVLPIERGAQIAGVTAGGVLFSLDAVDQARILSASFHKVLHWAVRNDLPLFLLSFPRMVRDSDYLLRVLSPWLSSRCDETVARDAFTAVADTSAVRFARDEMMAPSAVEVAGGRPDPNVLERVALLERLEELRSERVELVSRAVNSF